MNCFGVALLHLATAMSLGNRFVSHWERCRSNIADASLSLDVNGLLVAPSLMNRATYPVTMVSVPVCGLVWLVVCLLACSHLQLQKFQNQTVFQAILSNFDFLTDPPPPPALPNEIIPDFTWYIFRPHLSVFWSLHLTSHLFISLWLFIS